MFYQCMNITGICTQLHWGILKLFPYFELSKFTTGACKSRGPGATLNLTDAPQRQRNENNDGAPWTQWCRSGELYDAAINRETVTNGRCAMQFPIILLIAGVRYNAVLENLPSSCRRHRSRHRQQHKTGQKAGATDKTNFFTLSELNLFIKHKKNIQ